VEKITITIFKYFKKHKAILYTILIFTFLIFGFFATQITFEEDISKLLPSTGNTGSEKIVLSNLKVKDKIFIQFQAKSDTVGADYLIETCDNFIEMLIEKDLSNGLISNVLYNIDEDLISDAINFLYENIPAFLDTALYKNIDTLLEYEHIEQQMAKNYSLLTSTGGFAYSDMIIKDPIALRNVFMSSFGNISECLGGNYSFYNNHIFTDDAKTVIIAFLSPNFKSFNSKQGTELVDLINDEIKSFNASNPDVEILYHGAPVQSVYNSKRIKADLLLTISVSLVLVFTLLLICFRNKFIFIYLLVPVVYGVVFALAIVYLIKGTMSLMAMGIGAIVMGVAFSYCLHVITHYKYVTSPIKVLKDQTTPVILGAITTIGAFVGLLLTKSELLQDFGLFASLGLAGTTLFCLIFLPHFFNTKNNNKSEKAFAILEKINSFPLDKQKWLIGTIVVVSIISIFASRNVEFDSNLKNIGYHDKKILNSKNLLSSKTTAGNLSTVYFSSVAKNLDLALINSKKLISKLDEAKDAGLIKDYSSPSSLFIPKGEQEKRINYWKEYWTNDKIKKLKQNIKKAGKKYNISANSFAPFFDMLAYDYEPVSLYDTNLLPSSILDNIIELTDNNYMIFVPAKIEGDNIVKAGDFVVKNNSDFVIIDPMYYTSDMVKVIHNDFNITLLISSIFVLIVLLISLKSVVLALLAFMPMALSWYIVLGMMSVFGIEFNLINIIISSFIFGVGVDYSIFIIDGLLAKFRTGEPLLTYHKTAIFFSAVILIIVVVSLLFAVHPAISSIGVATLIGMVSTILISYSLQPFLFSILISNRAEKGLAPLSIRSIFSISSKNKCKKIKNNYLYKGNAVERNLNKELLKTKNYELLSKYLNENQSLLDYGCGSAYCCYWASLVNDKIKITGFDDNKNSISIANNCYQKTNLMNFTSDFDKLNTQYDVVMINSDVNISDEEPLEKILSNAKTIFIRKTIKEKYYNLLDPDKFKVRQEDNLYIVFSIK
jgi:predicted RND superfamily exporter protein